MVSKKYKQQWALWFNGLVRILVSGVFAGLGTFVVNGMMGWATGPKEVGMVVLGTVVGHLIGWYQQSPMPPLIDVEEVTVQDTHTTTTTTTSTPAEGQS